MKKTLSFVLALVMVLGLLPHLGLTPHAEQAETAKHSLAGKKLSILGDSISTMGGVSNNTNYNSTIGGNSMYYPNADYSVALADTWWQQAIDALGMELCVSNAWSGSCIFDPTPKASTAYVDRCVQLHNDHTGEEPDIIAVYLGTNDAGTYPDTVGKAADINYDTLIVEGANGYTYADPQTASEAYAIMLHKISQRYPNAEVYCFTIVNRNTFNDTIRTIAKRFGAYVVDLYQKSGLVVSHANDPLFMKGWHPTAEGMDAITNCFLSSIYENSRYVTADTHKVTYNLSGVRVDQGTAYAVLDGSAFAYSLSSTVTGNTAYPDVTVTMGGKDITSTCYANGKITIENVTGDITIQAKAHNHSYTSVVTNPTCAEDGYTTYTCACGVVYTDSYVEATEKHNYVNGICSGCGQDGIVLHKYEGGKTYYKTLEEALAAADSGTVTLLADVEANAIVLKPGVTLNLNGYTLTAELVFALDNATITDGAACTGGGLLKIAKGNLAFAKDNGGVIPVWNGKDGYVFTKVIFQQLSYPVDKSSAQYIFLPSFSNSQVASLLADGGADNDLKIRVGLTWNNGQCQQFYTYADTLLEQVFASGGGLAFSLSITGIANMPDMVASAEIVTDCGGQAASNATRIELVKILDTLEYRTGHALLPVV